MKKLYSIFILLLLTISSQLVWSQVVTTAPIFPTENSEVTLTFDASLGNQGLKDYTGDVYAHTGVITDKSTSGSDWKYTPTWGDNSAKYKLTSLGNNKWELKISPNIREYYGVQAAEEILKMAFVFRSADNSKEGKDIDNKDIFVDISKEGLNVSITSPINNSIFGKDETVTITANSADSESLQLLIDGVNTNTTSAATLSYSYTPHAAGNHQLVAVATEGANEARDTVNIIFREDTPIATKPSGLVDGINYISTTSVSLQLYAPYKQYIFVLGDFNDWTLDNSYQMNKDGDYFWLTIDNLTPGQEYIFQYLIDGKIKIADPYADKLLDPWNDQYISDATYPNLIAYPTDKTSEFASVFQTAQTNFTWDDTGFTMPDHDDLVIYELLIRDFTEAGNIKTVTDTLDYLQRLGVNAIELMPFNEFEGNNSWGYNPAFYFAPDKAYGTKNDYKTFINECHKRGIAVIMDMVLNHSFGQSPFFRMYTEGGKPSAENPWYNVNHNFENPDAHWGADFNHESAVTQKLVDRINAYWIEEYHIDGYRFDFTKGFSNTPHTISDDIWGSKYDADRIRLLKRMADQIWAENDKAFISFEHLADNYEEKELAAYGINLWGNANGNYSEATMGYNESGKSDLSWTSWKNREWTAPRLISYMESHDEERLMYKNLQYGNSNGDYNVKDLNTALSRIETAGAIFFATPGPKMIWQFGELGYDYSIDENGRVGKKPIRWDYQTNPDRKHLYQVFSALIKLKTQEPAFSSENYNLNVSGALKRVEINHTNMDIRVIANFDVKSGSITPNFSKTGTWFDYFSGNEISVSDISMNVNLAAGEYHIYTTKQLDKPIIPTAPDANNLAMNGVFEQDGVIKATYSYVDFNGDTEGNSILQWYLADDQSGTNETAITGANTLEYTISRQNVGRYLRFSVTPVATSGELLTGNKVYSAYSQPIDYSTGIEDVLDEELILYPNPVKDLLHLDNLKQVKRINLYSLTGKIILYKQNPDSNEIIDLSFLSQGIYILVFDLYDGDQLTRKIIKQ
ncbi:T9SS C-terminal target domain-containing protein [Ancylomarina euxinus]|uniref:T9SS C-terminal target domain-containing protein n=1 Tax=Ancylomarina euxinus TaxID=2283627 RepID=A0A425XXN4_9BACT|nr:alpha-amylase family glycosyl hydrolase [Ancylomarina euxinus]MCZ4694735.1 alpha-amylase family glycosyl hydrolase [Ancylomarina euxinus]MUP16399.1 T9SS type A sorting domain-containing protein [Ancylomarina euxinus]RRG19430.1 T9SS C-terminal target domain-containing protein [Ancylomarina euxinus]